jgi:zinc transporter ZupT
VALPAVIRGAPRALAVAAPALASGATRWRAAGAVALAALAEPVALFLCAATTSSGGEVAAAGYLDPESSVGLESLAAALLVGGLRTLIHLSLPRLTSCVVKKRKVNPNSQ